jgi:hypothetical protein
MAGTVWTPAPYISKQDWLLADGSIVTSPEFEQSGSGRRVRVVGTKDSIGSRQVDTLIQATIDKIAAQRGTTRMIRVYTPEEADYQAIATINVPESVFTDAVTLHMLQNNTTNRGTTVAVWKYQAEAYAPIQAYVFVMLEQRYNESYLVNTRVLWRDTRITRANENNMVVYDGANFTGYDLYRYSEDYKHLEEWITKNSLPFNTEPISYQSQMRTAVMKFAERCREVDMIDELTLPTGDNASRELTFQRITSNYSASFNAELLDYVQTGPVLERIQTTYDQLLNDFKTLGIVVNNRMTGGDLAQAIHGDLTKIAATVRANEDEDTGNTIDPHHTVSFDFATGTVVVDCGRQTDLTEVSEAWEIAKFKAEMTGEEEALYAYAKAYREPREQARLKKIIKQRKAVDEP